MAEENIEYVKLKIRRGLDTELSTLDEGEPAFTTNSNKFFIGSEKGNIEMAKQETVKSLETKVDTKADKTYVDQELADKDSKINNVNSSIGVLSGQVSDAQGKIDTLSRVPNGHEWTAAEGQITYVLPENASYDVGGKWLEVTVGGAPVIPSMLQIDSERQFTLKVPAASIPAGVKVVARWVEPFIPAAAGHGNKHEAGGADEIDVTKLKNFKESVEDKLADTARIIEQDTIPADAKPGDFWLDTGDNKFQGTVFEGLDSEVKQIATQLDQKVEFIEQDTEPQDAEEGDFWLDTGDNAYQGTVFEEIDSEVKQLSSQLADAVLLISPAGLVLNVANDGSQDISVPLLNYAAGKDEIYLHFPQGVYRWENNTKLTNKKIKFTGDNAVIEHYGSGSNLEIGDVVKKSTEEFFIQGITFVNKKPKPASNGTGVSSLVIADCVKTTIRDVDIYDSEQYGIMLRKQNGTLKQVILDNVNVYRCAGSLATTTSIALETRAASGDGKINNLKMTNCYFEVVDTFTNDQGGTTTVALSNASKLQACDEIEMTNVTFVGGKENGTLTFAYDTKKVKMTNVVMKSLSTISKAITISYCPNLEIEAVNCEIGIENFVQSIGINDSLKKAKFTNCKLQRLTKISGSPKNFEFNACEFFLPSSLLNIPFDDSTFNNCHISPNSPVKDIIVSGNNNKLVNFTGINIYEISGNDNKIVGGECDSLRPSGSSARGFAKGVKATSADRALRIYTQTVMDWIFENCTFERTVGGGTSHFAYVQGTRNKVINCTFRQLDKTLTIGYPLAVINATDCEVIEKKNYFDVNKTAAYNISVTTSTGTKQYEIGDVFVNGGVPQFWNGTEFKNLTTA